MVLTIRVPLKKAETAKKELIKLNILLKEYTTDKDCNFIYFPISNKIDKTNKMNDILNNCEFVNKNLEKTEKINSIQDYLKTKLKKTEINLISASYDVVGDIAIIEINEEQKKIEKKVARAILEINKNVKTVVKKGSEHLGEYRTQKTVHLAGKKKKETVHKESGVRIKLNIDTVYFSIRSSNERLRIAGKVKDCESVLIMFSGAAPFGLVIAKNANPRKIVCIEKNPEAHKYALENIAINKINKDAQIMKCIKGDVGKIVPKLKEKFDRIIMPLPKTAVDFLPLALKASKKGTIIHLYAFPEKNKINEFREDLKKTYKNIRIIDAVECGSFSPAIVRVCFDLRVQ